MTSILADNEQSESHFAKPNTYKPRTTSKPGKAFKPAPVAKPPPGRIKSTPTSGQKRKRAPAPTPDPDEDSGIDLPINKSPLAHKQHTKPKITTATNKKRKASPSSSDHDSGFDEDF
ncbi:hypothetical protein Slin14017_G098870 [Septoria linicola]|nr:hypothetical protein Slin14017_G098870 [Septoria linicola]